MYEILVGRTEVKSTNAVIPKSLYIALHNWLIEADYCNTSDADFPEIYYWEERSQHHGKEFFIWWRPEKAIEGNQFYVWKLVIDIHGVGMKPVEIMAQGKKVKAERGKIEILMQAKLEVDTSGSWQNNKLLAPFLEPFLKRIYRKEIEMHRKQILGDLKTMQDTIKQWFDIGAFALPKSIWWPAKGYQDEFFQQNQ